LAPHITAKCTTLELIKTNHDTAVAGYVTALRLAPDMRAGWHNLRHLFTTAVAAATALPAATAFTLPHRPRMQPEPATLGAWIVNLLRSFRNQLLQTAYRLRRASHRT
jgi:hypothetical protein